MNKPTIDERWLDYKVWGKREGQKDQLDHTERSNDFSGYSSKSRQPCYCIGLGGEKDGAQGRDGGEEQRSTWG